MQGRTTDTHGKTVLVVEDEVLVRMFAADILSHDGFAVLEAESADEALAILEAHPDVALLFTDINMPGPMDGLHLAGMVAALRPHMKLIVTSGRHRLKDIELPDSAAFLEKPYTAGQLSALVHRQAKVGGDPAADGWR